MTEKTIYFGYGSNLWLDQMKRRCPDSKYIGIGSLANWKWIINVRGYANVVPSEEDIVYGLIYELTPADERSLDIYEGTTYEKQFIPIEFYRAKENTDSKVIDALVYVDVERKLPSHPRTEYIFRMNMGIEDALKEGVPSDYIEKYLRPFIPPPDKYDLLGSN